MQDDRELMKWKNSSYGKVEGFGPRTSHGGRMQLKMMSTYSPHRLSGRIAQLTERVGSSLTT